MIQKLFNHLNKDYKVIEILLQKQTARCPLSVIVEYDNSKKLVVIANTKIQKFYLKRSIEKQKEFYEDFSKYFKFNFPELTGDLNDFSYAIYPYLDNLRWANDSRPIEIIEKLYSENAVSYEMTDDILQKIEDDFLLCWPPEYRSKIKQSDLYQEYFNKIKSLKEAKIFKEHSDYAVNNILTDGKDMYLMDFEFSKNFQVVGHDEYHYKKTVVLEYKNTEKPLDQKTLDNIKDIIIKKKPRFSIFNKNAFKNEGSKYYLNEIKSDLIDYANNLLDNKKKKKWWQIK